MQTDDWLTWLAQQMQEHNQIMFSPGHIQPEWLPKGWVRIAYYVFFSLVGALLLGLTFMLAGAITDGSFPGWILSLLGALSGGLSFAFASMRIRPVESIRPASVRRRILSLFSFVALWTFLLFDSDHGNVLGQFGTAVIALSLVPLLIGELIRALPGAVLHPLVVKSGDSLQRSRQNGVSIGLLTGTSFGLIVALLYFIGLLHGDVLIDLLLALPLGLLNGLVFGGLAALQLSALYRLLRYGKCIPKDYVSFLNYVVERALLRKVGSGYMFIHPLLRDYFALPHTELMDD